MKNIQNDKSPRNDGLTKEFYEGFCNEIKKFYNFSNRSKSQRWIKPLTKKERQKIHQKLAPHFFIQDRQQNNFKSSFRKFKKCSL